MFSFFRIAQTNHPSKNSPSIHAIIYKEQSNSARLQGPVHHQKFVHTKAMNHSPLWLTQTSCPKFNPAFSHHVRLFIFQQIQCHVQKKGRVGNTKEAPEWTA